MSRGNVASASTVTAFRLTTGEATKRIQSAAAMSERVIFGDHALERMEERSITDAQVYEALRSGFVLEPPAIAQPGEWRCKIVKQLRGGRTIGVVTVILKDARLFIKTVEWEDPR